jgi:hypothetical protein
MSIAIEAVVLLETMPGGATRKTKKLGVHSNKPISSQTFRRSAPEIATTPLQKWKRSGASLASV